MSKIIIAGSAAVVTSAFKKADLEKLKKYAPDSLVLKDEKENPVFMVSVGSNGSMNAHGIVFDGVAPDGSGLATMTQLIPNTVAGAEAINKWVMDTFGTSLLKLNELEGTLQAALDKVAADEAAVIASVEVLG